MRWAFGVKIVAAVATIASARARAADAADSTGYLDGETGFQFSQYAGKYSTDGNKIIYYRIAVPTPVSSGTPYDTVVQIVAPVEVGWAGLAWGGKMTGNPLTVAWANGNSGMISSRYATSHTQPPSYSGASYEILKTGTHSNYSHWQVTARCTGCTSYLSLSNSKTYLKPTAGNRLAFAACKYSPSNRADPNSNLQIHDVFNYWNHDFSSGSNSAFSSLVSRNGGHPGTRSVHYEDGPVDRRESSGADTVESEEPLRRSHEEGAGKFQSRRRGSQIRKG